MKINELMKMIFQHTGTDVRELVSWEVRKKSVTGNRYWYIGPETELFGRRCMYISGTQFPSGKAEALVLFSKQDIRLINFGYLRKSHRWVKAATPYEHSPQKAHKAVSDAIREGILIRSRECELCGGSIDNPRKEVLHFVDMTIERVHPTRIVAHHWLGYAPEHMLDVWWVCPRCNGYLVGMHDGNLSKEEAKTFVKQYY